MLIKNEKKEAITLKRRQERRKKVVVKRNGVEKREEMNHKEEQLTNLLSVYRREVDSKSHGHYIVYPVFPQDLKEIK